MFFTSVTQIMSINCSVDDCTQNVQTVLMYIKCIEGLQVLGGHCTSERCVNIFLFLIQLLYHRISVSLLDIYVPQHMLLEGERRQLISGFSYISGEQSYTRRRCLLWRLGAKLYRQPITLKFQKASAMYQLCDFG